MKAAVFALPAALIAGPLSVESAPLTLLVIVAMALTITVMTYPAVAVYVFLAVTPLVAGIDRGRLVPILRPNEALLLLLIAALSARGVYRLGRDSTIRAHFDRIDVALIAMAFTSSVVPLLWLMARDQPVTSDDVSHAFSMWKYYALYRMVRFCVRSPGQVRVCLWIALVSAAIVAIVAILQSLQLFGVPELLAIYHAPFGNELALSEHRGTSTLASSHAVADVLTFSLAIALAWLARNGEHRILLWGAIPLLTLGILSAGQFSGVIAFVVAGTVLGILTHRGRRIVLPSLIMLVIAGFILRPVVENRLNDFASLEGPIPRSWAVRWENLTHYFWPELFSDFNYLLGVRPSGRLPAPDPVQQWIWIESGHTWLLWTGGIPFLCAFLAFLVISVRMTARIARDRHDEIGVAAIAACTALWVVGILMIFDAHLTMRGTADLLFPLLALALVPSGRGDKATDVRRDMVAGARLPPGGSSRLQSPRRNGNAATSQGRAAGQPEPLSVARKR